jgi:hypothetical protein
MSFGESMFGFVRDHGLATVIVLFIGWFLVAKLWPWYTSMYLPLLLEREEQRDRIIHELRDVVLELKGFTAQLVSTVQLHDANTRDLTIALGSNQQAILDLLTARDERIQGN